MATRNFVGKWCCVKNENKKQTNKKQKQKKNKKQKTSKTGSVIFLLENFRQAVNIMKKKNVFLNSLSFARSVVFSVTLNSSKHFNVKLTKKE